MCDFLAQVYPERNEAPVQQVDPWPSASAVTEIIYSSSSAIIGAEEGENNQLN